MLKILNYPVKRFKKTQVLEVIRNSKNIVLVNIHIEHQYADKYVPQSIVLLNGSGNVKAGFSWEDHQFTVSSSIIAYPNYSSQIVGVSNRKYENGEFQKANTYSVFAISFLRLICVYSTFYLIKVVPPVFIVIVITVFNCSKSRELLFFK